MKKIKSTKQAHTANTKYGMGDYQGAGVRNPMGRMTNSVGPKKLTSRKLNNPPKSLA